VDKVAWNGLYYYSPGKTVINSSAKYSLLLSGLLKLGHQRSNMVCTGDKPLSLREAIRVVVEPTFCLKEDQAQAVPLRLTISEGDARNQEYSLDLVDLILLLLLLTNTL
jgi:hypothetical protein